MADIAFRKKKRESEQRKKRVAIVGGGYSGFYALKAILEAGHDARIYEAASHIGGMWRYSEQSLGGVWENACATSSKTFLHPSDFPFPEETPVFPHHSQIMAHLQSYVTHFDLESKVYTDHKVVKAYKRDGCWELIIENQSETFVDSFDSLVICTGQNQKPAKPKEKIYNKFTGPIKHTHEYKHPTEDMINKRILVVGGGESASDIANEASEVAQRIYMSIRNGQWFLSRHTGGRLAFDTRFSRKSRTLATNYGNNLVVKLYELMYATSNGEGGHGINEWKPTVPLMNEFINKSREVLDRVVRGKVVPRRGVHNIEGNLVWFEGEKNPVHIDMIILATGYQATFPFFDKPRSPTYKYVFDPDDPTLAYVGMVRPVFGSIMALAELQARWIAAYLSGDSQLPSTAKMKEEMVLDACIHKKRFPSKHERVPQLVSHFEYADYVTKQINAKPNYWRLFLTDNKKWRVLMDAPWTPFESLVTHPTKGEEAYKNLLEEYRFRRDIDGPSLFFLMIGIMLTTILSIIFFFYLFVKMFRYLFTKKFK